MFCFTCTKRNLIWAILSGIDQIYPTLRPPKWPTKAAYYTFVFIPREEFESRPCQNYTVNPRDHMTGCIKRRHCQNYTVNPRDHMSGCIKRRPRQNYTVNPRDTGWAASKGDPVKTIQSPLETTCRAASKGYPVKTIHTENGVVIVTKIF